MSPALLLSVALTAPAAPVPRDTDTANPGPAPRVVAVKPDGFGAVRVTGTIPTKVTVTSIQFVLETVVENGKQVQKQVQKEIEQDIVTSQYFSKELTEFDGKFATADGVPLTADEALARVRGGATLLASSDGKPVSKAWLKTVSADTVVMTADGLSHLQLQWGGDPLPTTPAPRLTLLGTDPTGKLIAPCTSIPLNGTVYYYDDFAEGRAFRGKRAFIGDGGYYGNAQNPATVVQRPLAEVKFDAYDRTGKRVERSDALKRLAAGGMVLVAGDTRMPDETYLKAFKEDVLVLMSPELVLPVVPVDQTKKKTEEKK